MAAMLRKIVATFFCFHRVFFVSHWLSTLYQCASIVSHGQPMSTLFCQDHSNLQDQHSVPLVQNGSLGKQFADIVVHLGMAG
jgi:hypothetical protein